MSDWSGKSDYDIDTLVRDNLDPQNPGHVYNMVHHRLEALLYTTSFDKALRVYRAQDSDRRYDTRRVLINMAEGDGWVGQGWLLEEATPRDLCIALLEAKGVTP